MAVTRSDIPREVNNFYDRTLLRRAVALFIHTRWGQVRDIPANAGTNTIKFRRYSNLAAATTALTEGVTPAGKDLVTTEITASVAQYGDYVTVSDVVNYESPDAVLTEAAQILGDQAGDTLDQLTRDILAAGTNVLYANGTSNGDVGSAHKITTTLIKQAVRTLKNGKAKRVTSMIDPSTGYNTTPVDAAYVGIVHPDTTYDLQELTGWIPVEKYPSNRMVMEGEVGAYGQVRFVETTNAKVFEGEGKGEGSGSIDVYGTIILGMDAYGVTRIAGQAMRNIVKPLGSAGAADPLEQRATSGWKATFVAKILNNDFLIRIAHAVST